MLFAGVDGAGKSESVNLLNEWLDPRWIVTRAYADPSVEESERPHFWRYWRDLPAHGQIGLFLSGWYSQAILDRVYRRSGESDFDYRLDHITAFERTLADDGALILKFWMHLGRSEQKRRLRAFEADPQQSWRVGKRDWRNWRRYDKFVGAAEQAIRRTDSGQCRWTIVDGHDPRHRSLTVLTVLRESLERHLEARRLQTQVSAAMTDATRDRRADELRAVHDRRAALEQEAQRPGRPDNAAGGAVTILNRLDLARAVPPTDYAEQWHAARSELTHLVQQARQRGIASIMLFEGWDAAGKGSAIRRITASLDARLWQVLPVAAPNDEERAHHYLWRFWRQLPRAGRVLILDRSWYGRVLVERVENLAQPEEWQRAYAEINDFEDQLLHHGSLLMKFWLHISPEEQYRRFKLREQTAYKQWKLTDEDWRNRAKWPDYELAVHEMVERTSTSGARWTLVEGNDKNFARLKILRGLILRFRQRLA